MPPPDGGGQKCSSGSSDIIVQSEEIENVYEKSGRNLHNTWCIIYNLQLQLQFTFTINFEIYNFKYSFEKILTEIYLKSEITKIGYYKSKEQPKIRGTR